MAGKEKARNDLEPACVAILAALEPSESLLKDPGPALRDAARLIAKAAELLATDFDRMLKENFAKCAYSRSVQVPTDRICWLLSSNRVESTPDLANRSIITRVRKKPPGFEYETYAEGSLIDHVRAKADYYLSCVFAVVRWWYRHGKPRTPDTRHDFREWCQTLDWITQQAFFLPPLLDGHQCEQQRIGNSGLSWLREVATSVDKLKRLEEGLRANDIIDVCEATDVQIPGCSEATPPDQIPMVIGKILKPIFSSAVTVEVGGYRIKRETRDEYDPENTMERPVHYHFFTRAEERSTLD